MKIQQAITSEQIKNLAQAASEAAPCVSLILPMEQMGPETRKNSIQLKSALKEIRPHLLEQGLDEGACEEFLEPAEKLIQDEEFWQHQGQALALYLGRGIFETFLLTSDTFGRHVSASTRFYLTPLIHTYGRQQPVCVLMLNQKHVELLRYERGELETLEVEKLPKDMEEALQIDPESMVQHHVANRGAGTAGPAMAVHGHGDNKDEHHGHFIDFLHSVESAVTRHMHQLKLPLYVASVADNAHHYRQINKYDKLAEEPIEGSFEGRPREELRQALEERLEEGQRAVSREARGNVEEMVATGNGTTDLKEAIEAVWDGRVATCFVAVDAPSRTGEWDSMERSVETDPEPTPRHPDLVDYLAVEAWCKGGEIRFTEQEKLPEQAAVAVGYRYTY